MITKFAIWKEQSSVSPGNLLMHPHTVDCWYVLFPSYPPLGYSPLGFFCAPALEVFFPRSIPSASRWSGFELSCTPSWEVCLVPFSTFVQHFSFFYGLPFFWAWIFVFMALNPCLSSHTSPISWLPLFWEWADVFTVHLGLSIYSFTVYTCLHPILHGKGYCNFFSIKL